MRVLSVVRSSPRSLTHWISHCRVDAAGVAAEWVEATAATETQPTIVYFLGSADGPGALERSRRLAGELAVNTRARVLTVACSSRGEASSTAAVEAGVAAYAWLLGEGCDPESTVFTHDATSAPLVAAILLAAGKDGLPVPGPTVAQLLPTALRRSTANLGSPSWYGCRVDDRLR